MELLDKGCSLLSPLYLEAVQRLLPEDKLVAVDIRVKIDCVIVRLRNLIVVLKFTTSTLASILCVFNILFQMLLADLLRNNAKQPTRSSEGHRYQILNTNLRTLSKVSIRKVDRSKITFFKHSKKIK